MRVDVFPQIAVVQADSPEEFERLFNEKARALADRIKDTKVEISGGIFSAVFHYQEKTETFDSIADEFHAEGIRYLCKHCPHLDDPEDKRVKHCKCKYAEFGRTHKEHEACEMFYRQLKQGSIAPIDDGVR